MALPAATTIPWPQTTGFKAGHRESRVSAEVLFTRSFNEAAKNSCMRRNHLAAWPGPFAGKFNWVSPPVLNSQTRVAVDVSCDRRAPGYRLRAGRRPGIAGAGNTDLRTGRPPPEARNILIPFRLLSHELSQCFRCPQEEATAKSELVSDYQPRSIHSVVTFWVQLNYPNEIAEDDLEHPNES